MADVSNQNLNQSIGDTTNVGSNSQSPTAKKDKKKTAASSHSKPSHPPTSQMVNGAIAKLKERGGSSLQAIKKYISANYKVDAEKMAPFIKKYLRSAVESGALIQTKGKGATGSFKLASASLNKPTKSVAANVHEKKSTKAKPKKKTVAQSSTGAKAKTAASKTKAAAAAKKATSSAKKAKKTAAVASSVAPSTSAIEKSAETTEIVGKRGGSRVLAAKTAAVAAVKKIKSSPKAKKPIKTASSPVKKPKAPKPKRTKAAASLKAKKAASPKKKK